jgi:multidrug transporter EmrE-like cation transporter
MIYLLFSILCSTMILVTFKLMDRYQIKVFPVILLNYVIASGLGYLFAGQPLLIIREEGLRWIPFSSLIGLMFILMFILVGYTIPRIGLSLTTISTRMAVVVPITFSILFYHEEVGFTKIAGILLALLAVFTTVFRKSNSRTSMGNFYLPVVLFLGSGLTDTILKFSQQAYVTDRLLPVFSATVFLSALLIGLVFLLFSPALRKGLFNKNQLLWAAILGSVNFGSFYFFLSSLKNSGFDSSIVFGVNHIAIISLTVLSGLVFFREKSSLVNKLGIILALISIIILTYW